MIAAGPYSRVAHLFRDVDPRIWEDDTLEELDRYTTDEVERILSSSLSTNKIKQIFLPLSLGRAKLKSASNRTRLLYLFKTGLESVKQKCATLIDFEEFKISDSAEEVQRPNDKTQIYDFFCATMMTHERVFLYQAHDSLTGAFLTAKPSGSTELKDEAFCTALRFRLGLDQLPAGFYCATHNVAKYTKGCHALLCQNL